MRYQIYMDYQHEQHRVHKNIHHRIWCPKRRRKVLVGLVRTRGEDITREVAAERNGTVVESALQPDYVQLFIRAHPFWLPSDIPWLITGRSSCLLREEFVTEDVQAVARAGAGPRPERGQQHAMGRAGPLGTCGSGYRDEPSIPRAFAGGVSNYRPPQL